MTTQLPAPFEVRESLVRELRHLIQSIAARSSMTYLTVPAAEFPAWLLALGRESFYAHTMRSGQKFIRAGYAVIGDNPTESPMVSVTCDTPPAPWVSYPEDEGNRRYMFRYNLLSDNEKESN